MTRMISRLLTGTVLSTALLAAPALAQDIGNANLPAVQLPAVQLPAVQLPAVQLPAVQLPAVQDGLPGADPLLDPDLALPADDALFDENLVAGLPEIHGDVPPDLVEGRTGAFVDEAMGTIPDAPGLFPGSDNGPDLAGLDPSNPVNQPGGPNDPAWGGNGIPGLMNDPRNTGNGQDEGRRNPSNTLADPRDMAAGGGHHSVRYTNGGWSQQWRYTDRNGDNHTNTEEYTPDGEGGWTQTSTHTQYGETWTTTQRSEKTTDADGNSTVINHPVEYERNHPVVIGPDDGWIASGAITLSASPDFLPETIVNVGLSRKLLDGWLVGLVIQDRKYPFADVISNGLVIERYFGKFHAAYQLEQSRLSSQDSWNHRTSLNFYPDVGGNYGLIVTAGDETEVVAPGQLLNTDVNSIVITGRHPVSKSTSILWRLGSYHQGSLYRRNMVGLSVAGAF